jgi:hypothetical protein
LKKRSKKLLPGSGSAGASRVASRLRAPGKTFFLLFFKKEDLPYFL